MATETDSRPVEQLDLDHVLRLTLEEVQLYRAGTFTIMGAVRIERLRDSGKGWVKVVGPIVATEDYPDGCCPRAELLRAAARIIEQFDSPASAGTPREAPPDAHE